MSVTIGDITFDRVEYDADADVLYLYVGDPSLAVDFDETRRAMRCASTARATWSA